MMRLSFLVAFALNCISYLASAQNCPILANANFTDVGGNLIDPNGLSQDQQVRINITLLNMDVKQAITTSQGEFRILLGEKLKLPKDIKLEKTESGQQFNWTFSQELNCLIGKLKTNLPADFGGIVFFDLQCIGTGSSSLKAQWVCSSDKVNNDKTPLNSVGFTIIPKAGGS